MLRLGNNSAYHGKCMYLVSWPVHPLPWACRASACAAPRRSHRDVTTPQANHRGWSDFFIDMYVSGCRGVPLSRWAVAWRCRLALRHVPVQPLQACRLGVPHAQTRGPAPPRHRPAPLQEGGGHGLPSLHLLPARPALHPAVQQGWHPGHRGERSVPSAHAVCTSGLPAWLPAPRALGAATTVRARLPGRVLLPTPFLLAPAPRRSPALRHPRSSTAGWMSSCLAGPRTACWCTRRAPAARRWGRLRASAWGNAAFTRLAACTNRAGAAAAAVLRAHPAASVRPAHAAPTPWALLDAGPVAAAQARHAALRLHAQAARAGKAPSVSPAGASVCSGATPARDPRSFAALHGRGQRTLLLLPHLKAPCIDVCLLLQPPPHAGCRWPSRLTRRRC